MNPTQPPRGRPPLPESEGARDVKDRVIEFRFTRIRKSAYKQAAYPESMNRWMERVLDEAARARGFEPEPITNTV